MDILLGFFRKAKNVEATHTEMFIMGATSRFQAARPVLGDPQVHVDGTQAHLDQPADAGGILDDEYLGSHHGRQRIGWSAPYRRTVGTGSATCSMKCSYVARNSRGSRSKIL